MDEVHFQTQALVLSNWSPSAFVFYFSLHLFAQGDVELQLQVLMVEHVSWMLGTNFLTFAKEVVLVFGHPLFLGHYALWSRQIGIVCFVKLGRVFEALFM